MGLPSSFTTKVVGVSFTCEYPDNVYRLQEVFDDSNGELAITLVHNPDNEYDVNAVEVHVDQMDSVMMGHIPAKLAARVAPELDAGTALTAVIDSVLVHPAHPENPGISIRVTTGDRAAEPF